MITPAIGKIGRPPSSPLPPPSLVPQPRLVPERVLACDEVKGRFHFNSPSLFESALVWVTLPGMRKEKVTEASLRMEPNRAWVIGSLPRLSAAPPAALATASNFQPSAVFCSEN